MIQKPKCACVHACSLRYSVVETIEYIHVLVGRRQQYALVMLLHRLHCSLQDQTILPGAILLRWQNQCAYRGEWEFDRYDSTLRARG